MTPPLVLAMPSTGVPILDSFLALLDTWGYLIVFGFTVFENLFVVGSLTPGETVVIAAAALASHERLALAGVWFASLIGTTTGSTTSYLLGRRAGLVGVRAFAGWLADTRVGRIMRVDDEAVDEVQEHFHKDGSKTVFLARFAIGAKNFVPAVAGATRMPFFWFAIYTILGSMVYTSLMCAIGWFLGANLERALEVASGIGYVGLALLLALLAGAWYGRRRFKARRASRRVEKDDEQARADSRGP